MFEKHFWSIFLFVVEILYYDGVTNEVFKRENMSKNQAMKVDEEFFRQDPESGVYKQIRCTVCEQNFTHPHPKHWHATGHRRNLRKLHESQESQALKDVKIQELTNSAGLLEVLTYETNTSGPMPLPYSGEEIPFSNSDDSKNWVEDISKKTEVSVILQFHETLWGFFQILKNIHEFILFLDISERS